MVTRPPVARSGRLRVAECVGPTFQREGPSAGELAMVIRLSGCNLSCPTCDVPFTWRPGRFDRAVPIDTLVDWVAGAPARLVVITGGEPLLQQAGVLALTTALVELGHRVEIETNATVPAWPELFAAGPWFVASPKLGGFAPAEPGRINPAALAGFASAERAAFCVVASTEADVAELAELERRYGLAPIWLAPEGTRAVPVLAGLHWLAQRAIQHGWNLSPRLHALLDRT